MKITANIATRPQRYNELKKMLNSIKGQFDEVRIYLNETNEVPEWLHEYTVVTGENLTDNGKFYFLQFVGKEIYCTLDDDIIYPKNYAISLRASINSYNPIVTHHGRILIAKDVSYYGGHRFFHCANNQTEMCEIDVAGTGVTAFDTSYFKPTTIFNSEYKCMSDILFGLEAAKQNKKIIVLPHSVGWIKPLPVDTSIYATHRHNESIQISLANKILDIKEKTKKNIVI